MISPNKNFEENLCVPEKDFSMLDGMQNENKSLSKTESGHFTISEEDDNNSRVCSEIYNSNFDEGGLGRSSFNAEGSDLEMSKNNKQDNFSIASFSSVSSSSSSLSSVGLTLESVKKVSSLSANQNNIKSVETHNNNNNNNNNNNHNNNNNNRNNSNNNNNENSYQVHHKIQRIPSTANPKYRIPSLQKNHRSKSQPHVQINHLFYQERRNSSPSNLNYKNIANKYAKTIKQVSSLPNFSNPHPHQQQSQEAQTQPPQQIIYLQIPQPSQSQLSDPQGLQQQISSQLQLLVPQIYSQLVNQIHNASKTLSTVNVNINPVHQKEGSEESTSRCPNKLLDSECTVEQSQSEGLSVQTSLHHTFTKNSSHQQQLHEQQQRQQQQQRYISNSDIKKLLLENYNESKNAEMLAVNQILQEVPLESHQTQLNSENSYIEIKQFPGTPKIIIPLTEELILQCQQLQHFKESNFAPYQPKLETILEESLSVKHLKFDGFSKTKIVACILTVMCVIVVVLLAGDKTIAVAVVASVFILFLLGSTFYLYTHSTRREIENSIQRPENPRLQINDYASRNNPTLV